MIISAARTGVTVIRSFVKELRMNFVEVDLTCCCSKDDHNQLLTKELSSHRQQTGNSELDVAARLTRLLESWSQGAGPTATDRAAPHPGPERGMWRVAGVVGGKMWGGWPGWWGARASHQFAGPGIAASPAT